MKLLCVLTSHREIGDSGHQADIFLPEIAHPHAMFRPTGYEMASLSPQAG